MHLIRTSAPQALPVSMAETLAGLGMEEGDEDARIAGLIRAATDTIDGPDGEIQRALITQVWEMRLDTFPGAWPGRPHFSWPSTFCPSKLEIEIPLPPLQSVESISYISDASEVELDPSTYTVAGVGDRHKARVRPVISWPTADDVPAAVVVTFIAGYGDSWNDVPEPIRQAIVATVQGMYDGCETGWVEKLLRPYRVDLGFA